MRQLQAHDYEKLENYWKHYPSFVTSIGTESSSTKRENLIQITNCIEQQFNDADEELQGIMRMIFWQGYGSEDAAEEFYITRSKVNRIKRKVLEETAERICWI